MNYEDEPEEGAEVVRPFMVTSGRVRADGQEVAIETMVNATAHGRLNATDLQFESRRIVNQFTEPVAVAEIAAVLELPLRAVQVLVSEMIGSGLLQEHETADRSDTALLHRIRKAVATL